MMREYDDVCDQNDIHLLLWRSCHYGRRAVAC